MDLALHLASHETELAKRLAVTSDGWQRTADGITSPGFRGASTGPGYDIGARLPEASDGVVEVGIGRSNLYRLQVMPLRAEHATANVPGVASSTRTPIRPPISSSSPNRRASSGCTFCAVPQRRRSSSCTSSSRPSCPRPGPTHPVGSTCSTSRELRNCTSPAVPRRLPWYATARAARVD